MVDFDCLLCHHGKCSKACGIIEPHKILRNLYFENRHVAENKLSGTLPCLNCDARCEDVCPQHVRIKDIMTSLNKKDEEKIVLDYDCLKTDFCGIPLENPFLLSSSVVASNYETCARGFSMGWAGAAFKTICLMDIVEASPRFSAVRGDNHRIIGFKNIEQLSDYELKENIETLKRLKKDFPNKFLMVSIMGRNDEEWAYLTDVMNDAGVDALELNFSCPNMTAENTGSDVGQIPELVERYTRVVKQRSRIPVIAKLTPNITHIEESADAAIRGGADGVAAINTIKSLIEVQVDPKKEAFHASIGGYSGKAVKPIAMRFIAELGKDENLKGRHISAMGGVENWKDALEFIALGAGTVQVTTAVMQFGYRLIHELKDGAALYMMKNGIRSINDLRFTSLDNVVNVEELDRSYIIYPKFLREKCVGCERCYVSCMDGGHQAIRFVDGYPQLDPPRCVGCHLCILVCPKEAIVSSEIRVPKKGRKAS